MANIIEPGIESVNIELYEKIENRKCIVAGFLELEDDCSDGVYQFSL